MTIQSPCRNICILGDDGCCDGCGRSLDEIARWLLLSPADRARVQERVAGWTPRQANAEAVRGVTKPSGDPR